MDVLFWRRNDSSCFTPWNEYLGGWIDDHIVDGDVQTFHVTPPASGHFRACLFDSYGQLSDLDLTMEVVGAAPPPPLAPPPPPPPGPGWFWSAEGQTCSTACENNGLACISILSRNTVMDLQTTQAGLESAMDEANANDHLGVFQYPGFCEQWVTQTSSPLPFYRIGATKNKCISSGISPLNSDYSYYCQTSHLNPPTDASSLLTPRNNTHPTHAQATTRCRRAILGTVYVIVQFRAHRALPLCSPRARRPRHLGRRRAVHRPSQRPRPRRRPAFRRSRRATSTASSSSIPPPRPPSRSRNSSAPPRTRASSASSPTSIAHTPTRRSTRAAAAAVVVGACSSPGTRLGASAASTLTAPPPATRRSRRPSAPPRHWSPARSTLAKATGAASITPPAARRIRVAGPSTAAPPRPRRSRAAGHPCAGSRCRVCCPRHRPHRRRPHHHRRSAPPPSPRRRPPRRRPRHRRRRTLPASATPHLRRSRRRP